MGRTIVCVDASSPAFARSLRRIRDPQRTREVVDAVRSLLLLDLDCAPAKLHLHQLKKKDAPSMLEATKRVPIWTVHVTADDCLKVSFTFEDGTVYLRVVKEHDALDADP